MDRIFIRGLKVVTVIGVFDWERRIPQTLSLDVTFAVDLSKAADTDTLDKTIDYAAVSQRLQDLAKTSSFDLVETFAERCAAGVMQEFGVPWIEVCVTKVVALPGRTEVGVVIQRGQLPAGDRAG